MKTKQQTRTNFVLFFLLPALVIISCGLISHFAFKLAIINGDSMTPTYHNFQFTIVNMLDKSYDIGDVVAIRLANGKLIVKRIVAKPNDTFIISNGKILTNGEKGIYGDTEAKYSGIAAYEIILSEDEYFVLGDNLDESRDSRYEDVGIINKSDILGKIIPQTEF